MLNSNSGHLIDARWALWERDWPQERDPAQTLLFTSAEPLSLRRLSPTYQHPAKLDCSGRGAALTSLSWLLRPPLVWPKSFCRWSAKTSYNDSSGDWPPDSPREAPPGLSQVRSGESGGWRAQRWCGGQYGVVDCGCWPRPAPPPRGVRPGARKTKGSCREQGMSSHSVWLHREPRPAQHSPPGGPGSGQPGQAPAAGRGSENKSGRAH